MNKRCPWCERENCDHPLCKLCTQSNEVLLSLKNRRMEDIEYLKKDHARQHQLILDLLSGSEIERTRLVLQELALCFDEIMAKQDLYPDRYAEARENARRILAAIA